MKIAIIDDEEKFRILLESTVRDYLARRHIQAEVVCFPDAETFLGIEEKDHFEIAFMDIYMSGMSGVEAALEMRRHGGSGILIFCTTSPDHMPDAFACHAFDYVVKPAVQARIDGVLDDAFRALPQMQRYLSFETDGHTESLLFADLVSVTTNGHYLIMDARDRHQSTVRMTISELMKELGNDERFLAINRGIIVNMDYVMSMNGTRCVLSNGSTLPIKVRESAEIIQKWHDYCFRKIRNNQSHMTERRPS